MEQVLAALQAETFPLSVRRNVRELGDKAQIEGMCLGVTNLWSVGPVLSRATKDRPELTRLLCDFARAELPPGLTFTSIQVNKDYRAALHVDGNNLGPSYIIGFGDYVGGELWLDDGSQYGHCATIRQRWLSFDGTKPHCVMPFRGRRYTLVFFTYSHPILESRLALGAQQALERLGFPLPLDIAALAPRKVSTPKDELLAAAKIRLARFCRRSATNGGIKRLRLHVRCPGGRTLQLAISPETPMFILADRIVSILASTEATPETEAERFLSVSLSLNSLRLLPHDTAVGLGLTSRDIVEARTSSYCNSSSSANAMSSIGSQAAGDANHTTCVETSSRNSSGTQVAMDLEGASSRASPRHRSPIQAFGSCKRKRGSDALSMDSPPSDLSMRLLL